jgi:type II secretory pathway pseudopilin PulG
MTLLELTMVLSILVVGFLTLSQAIVASMRVTRTNRESALATDGLRSMAELLQGDQEFATLFQRYNGTPGDFAGPGAEPGDAFDVPGLQAAADDPDGRVGEIVFPVTPVAGAEQLHETLVDPELGMPRDLDGDGFLTAGDKSGSYRLLPVLLRLSWQGNNGPRSMDLRTLIADR